MSKGVELLVQQPTAGAVVTQASVRKGQLPRDGAEMREFTRSQPFMQDVTRWLEQDRAQERGERERFIESLIKNLDRGRELGARGPMATIPPSGYSVHTGTSAIALTGTTAKTVMYLLAGTSNPPSLTEFSIGFDGVTASNVSALIEYLLGTAASNSTPGTGSTTFTAVQTRVWPTTTPITTAANNCSSEPTVLTVARPWLLTPNAGLLVVQFPLGREPTGLVTASTSGKVLAVRVTAPNNVNSRGYLDFEE